MPTSKSSSAAKKPPLRDTLTNFMVEHARQENGTSSFAALDAPLKDLPQLRKLLTEPSVFDESK
jgi:hypothetical protein